MVLDSSFYLERNGLKKKGILALEFASKTKEMQLAG
jgi:hypothetical protein